MGQQQLLLLVLTTIIIAISTLAGIQAFSESQRQSAINRMTQKAVEIASDVQEYAQRPAILRPGNDTAEDEASALAIGFSELPHYEPKSDGIGGDDYFDEVAQYSLNGSNSLPDDYNDNACPDNGHVNTVNAYSEKHDVSVCVSITGTSAQDLETGVAQ